MSHILLIQDKDGNLIASVPVKAGYKVREVSEEKLAEINSMLPPDKKIDVGDKGGGEDKVG
jgi:hypothetical protein